MNTTLLRLARRLRHALTHARWKELAPVLVLAAVLVVIGAVVGLGTVGSPDRTASPPGSAPGSPTGSTAPTDSPSPPPSGAGSPSASGGRTRSGGSTLDPSSLPSVPGCLAPRTLTVLTFNIHGGRTPHGVDLAAFVKEIRAAHADVVLLQEVDKDLWRTGFRDEPEILARGLGMHVYYHSRVRSNAILSRFPVTSWRSTRLPLRPGREERRLVEATIVVDGQRVHVFTTHLDQSVSSLRLAQIRTVKRLMRSGSAGPAILGGDLNAHPGGPVYRTVRSYLRDSWTEVGRGPGLTVPARHPRGRIDYLFHNSWLTPRAAQVLPSRASDHRALRVAFDLWGQEGCGT